LYKCDQAVGNPRNTKQVYYIQNFENYEILRGRADMGNYHLKAELPQQGAFIVNGQKGKYCVTLFPKETCQCESNSTCYHILAAKMSIGLE